MNFLLYSTLQIFVLLLAFLVIDSSPVPTNATAAKESENGAMYLTNGKPDFPVADLIEENQNIKTNVIGRMDDLEATTWVSNLSELNFTIPPPVEKAHDYEDTYN